VTGSPGAVPQRPFPSAVEPEYQQFFAGLADGLIIVRRCTSCGTAQWPPRDACGHCHGTDFVGAEVAQQGTVYTCSVVQRAFQPWFAERVPYGIAVVDVGQGIRLMGNVFGPDVERLRIGVPARAVFAAAGEFTVLDWTLPGQSADNPAVQR
jgi:uncharacterized OB-fold protein